MKKEAALTVLEEAMEVERQGEAFYQEAAELVQDPTGKKVFDTLAKDEMKHLRLLQTEYEAIQNDNEWVDLDEAKAHGPKASLKLFPDKRDAALIIPADATDLDALTMAMGFEEKGYNTYHRASAEADDSRAKELFDFLARQENGHYVFLQKTHEYLTPEGAWFFDEREFPMFEGG
jgi:rubrerythrin